MPLKPLVVSTAVLALAFPITAASQPVRFEIPAQDLGTALRAFAATSGRQVAFDATLVRGKRSRRLVATMTPEAAMTKLLAGSGLTYMQTASGLFIVTAKIVTVRASATKKVRPLPPEPSPSEIVVTARKRDERAIDVPVAISVATGLSLERRGVRSVADFLQQFPGVGIYDYGNGVLKVTIRGISTSLGGNENGYYLDDLPFTGVNVPISPDVRAWDLERVEVLRGPQGTLFGEGSLGGTIRTLTRGADLDRWEGKASAYVSQTDGGGMNRGVKVAVNAPIIPGILAIRLAGTAERLPGWIDDEATGRHDLNDQKVTTFRSKARLDPTDRLSIAGSYWFYKGSFPGGDATATDDGQQSRSTVLSSTVKYRLHGLSARYDLGGAEAFYGYSHGNFTLPQSGLASGGQLHSFIKIKLDAHEARLSSTRKGPLQWTVGAYLRDAIRHDDFKYPSLNIDYLVDVKSKARALFGEATYTLPFVPVDVTAGLRYYRERITGLESDAGLPPARRARAYESWNPRFSLAWHPLSTAIVYVSAAKGFRSGQLQPTVAQALAPGLPPMLEQDSVWTYELGGKAELFDRLLTLEGALYRSDWKNVAVRVPIGDTGYNGLLNSKGSRTLGLEASAAVRPAAGLVLTASGTYVDAVYSGSVPGTGIVAGAAVEDVARFTASASAEYRTSLTDVLTGFGRMDWQHSSPRRLSAFGRYLPGDRIDLVGARLGVEARRYSIALFVDNLTNETGGESAGTVQPIASGDIDIVATRPRPRTYGLEMSFLFR